MKKTQKTLTLGLVILSIITLILLNTVSAATTVEYKVDPQMPTPESEVTVTADITGEGNITAIWLEMQECTAGSCYGWKTNASMQETADMTYETDIKLDHDDAAYFSLRLVINRNGEWETTEEYKVDLNLDDNGNNGSSESTPGFETILFLVSLIAGAILLQRKRAE